MNFKRASFIFLFLFCLSLVSLSQSENVDPAMIYKIKQEGFKKSTIEELAFWLTDFVGPRLTG